MIQRKNQTFLEKYSFLRSDQRHLYNSDSAIFQLATGDSMSIDPVIEKTSANGFILAWSEQAQSGQNSNVYAQLFSEDTISGDVFRVNSDDESLAFSPRIKELRDNSYIISWASMLDSSCNIYAKLYDPDAQYTIQINENDAYVRCYSSDIIALLDGNFVVTWSAQTTMSDWDIYGKKYSSTGDALSQVFRINDYYVDTQYQPAATLLSDGGFLVVWSSVVTNALTAVQNIYGKYYSSDGVTGDADFQISNSTATLNYAPDVANLASTLLN